MCVVFTGSLPAQRHFDDGHFRDLFDGESLAGWVTEGGRYDGHAVWSVEDGAITGREGDDHAGGLIYTSGTYANCIFSCEVRLQNPFDSGIFLRMVPPGGGKGAQVTLDYRPGGEIGGIYADGYLHHNESAADAFANGEWNSVEVRCTGRDMHIEAWLNGVLITDYQQPAGAAGYAPRGRIGLQVHGGRDDPAGSRVQFRRIKLLELPEFDRHVFAVDTHGRLTPTEAGVAQGWRALLAEDGLDGWQAAGGDSGFAVEGGVLAMLSEGAGRFVRTQEAFRDFELRLDFKTARGANSGVFLRGDPARGDPAYSGCEVQILDDFHWQEDSHSELAPWQFTGSLYAAVPPSVQALAPLGRWNTFDIRYVGAQLRVSLNGQQLYDVDTFELQPFKGEPFAQRAAEGFIGLQRHAPSRVDGPAYAWFRNVFVRPL